MRNGFTEELRELIYRADPSVQLVPEFVVTVAEGVKELQSEWDAADDLTGLESLVAGGVRLVGDDTGIVEQPNNDGDTITGLTRATGFDALIVRWQNQPAFRSLGSFTARLHPRVDAGSPKTVAFWRCQAYRVARIQPETAVRDSTTSAPGLLTLEPITEVIEVAALGEAEGDVNFNFRTGVFGIGAFIGSPPSYDGWIGQATTDAFEFAQSNPTGFAIVGDTINVFKVWAVDANGNPADNVAWMANSTVLDANSNQRHLFAGGEGYATSRSFRDPVDGITSGSVVVAGALNSVPDFKIGQISYTEATVGFTGAGNDIDLGSAPTNTLECLVGGATPGGAVISAQINDGGGWVDIADGDIIGEDNTSQGGNDLSGVAVQQSYTMRATLTPGSGGFTTPILRQLGVRELTITPVYGTTIVTGAGYAVDPITHRGEITEPTIVILRTGERDYLDYGSLLLSQNHIGDIQVRLFVGHPDTSLISRQDWLHLDSYEVEDYEAQDAALVIRGRSVMARLRTQFPAFVETAPGEGERQPVEYSNAAISDVLADIVDGQVGLIGRYRGPLPQSTTTVSNIIEEADAKNAIDELAFLAGQAVIASQGKVRGVQLGPADVDGETPIAWFPMTDKVDTYISPGFEQRMDEVFVKWGWFEEAEEFDNEVRFFNGTALTKLGGSGLQSTQFLDEGISRWIVTESHAIEVARAMTTARGVGMLLWRFKPIFPQPHLEPGDMIAMETDQFVGKSPISNREIKGPIWVTGRVQDIRGFLDDQEITMWVYSWEDIKYAQDDITRLGYKKPKIIEGKVNFEINGDITVRFWTEQALSVRAVANTAYATSGTVDAQAAVETDVDGYAQFTISGAGFDVGDLVRITARAYENDDGTGAAQTRPDTWRAELRRGVPGITIQEKPSQNEAGTEGTLEILVADTIGAVIDVRFKSHTGGGEYNFDDPLDGSWTVDTTVPYSSTVAISSKFPSRIAYAVRYRGLDGAIYVITGDHVFDFGTIPRVNFSYAIIGDDVFLSHFGDEDTLAYRYTTALDPASPAVPNETNGTLVAGSSSEGTLIYAGLAFGETLRMRARGYNSALALDTDDQSPEDYQVAVRRQEGLTNPNVSEALSFTYGSGTTPTEAILTLDLADPSALVTRFAYKTNSTSTPALFSDPDTDGGWSLDVGPVFTLSAQVSLQAKHQSQIGYAYEFDPGDGDGARWFVHVINVDADEIPKCSVNAAIGPDQVPQADVQGDDDMVGGSVAWAFAKTNWVDDAAAKAAAIASGNTIDGRNPVIIPAATTMAVGETGYFAVVPYSGPGATGFEGEVVRANTGEATLTQTIDVTILEWQRRITTIGNQYFVRFAGWVYGPSSGVEIAYTSSDGNYTAILDSGDSSLLERRYFGGVLLVSGDYDGVGTAKQWGPTEAALNVQFTATGIAQAVDGASVDFDLGKPEESYLQVNSNFEIADGVLKLPATGSAGSSGAIDFDTVGPSHVLVATGNTELTFTNIPSGTGMALRVVTGGNDVTFGTGIETLLGTLDSGTWVLSAFNFEGTISVGGVQVA